MAGSGDRLVFDEPALLAAAREGNVAAFGELYRRYLADVRGFCTRRIGDPARAEDLAQDAFMRAFERMPTYRLDRPFWPWLSTIAKNLCVDELRQRSRQGQATSSSSAVAREQEPAPGADQTFEDADQHQSQTKLRSALVDALAGLSAGDRQLFWQHEVEGVGYDQLARAVGSTVDGVRNATWRARGRLRLMLARAKDDFDSYLLIPIPAVVGRLRRARAWIRSRMRLDLAAARPILLDQGVSLFTGISMLSIAWIGTVTLPDRLDAPAERPPVGVLRFDEATTLERGVPGGRGDNPRLEAHGISVHQTPLSANIETRSRQRRPAPASTRYRIEIYGPDGQMIYWEQTDIDCFDRQESKALPEQDWVKAYC